ncbi:MAG: helix-turn-helix domain-containing protein [Alphaproteobacteria bacterium]|nr:helix-turn-helix domain-containing protein [Alphaproteobacteria bacterium]
MFEALRNAVKAEGLEPKEKLLLIIICDHLNAEQGQIAWPSNNKLAALSGFSKKTVIEAKKMLVEKGLLYSHQRFNSSNLYKVNIDKIKSYIPEKDGNDFACFDEGIQASVINSPTSETTSLAESKDFTPEEKFLHPPSVKKLIYTPKIQINNILKNEAFVDLFKFKLGALNLENWLEKANKVGVYEEPLLGHKGKELNFRFSAYQLLSGWFNEELACLTAISDPQWNMAVDIYSTHHKPPVGEVNLKAIYTLCRFIGSKERTPEVWRAVGGEGMKFPNIPDKL